MNCLKWFEIYSEFKREEAVSYLIGNKIDLKDRYYGFNSALKQRVLKQEYRKSKICFILESAPRMGKAWRNFLDK